MVAVMDKGELIEIWNLKALFGSKDSAFSKLYYLGMASRKDP